MREQIRSRGRAMAARPPAGWRIQRTGSALQRGMYVTTMLAIALGAALGANLRYALSLWAAQRWDGAFPYGTLLINVIGSFVIGFIMVLGTRITISVPWRLLIVTGLLGGFTTFSTFSYETYALYVGGNWRAAGLNLLASVGLGLAGVFLGAGLARALP